MVEPEPQPARESDTQQDQARERLRQALDQLDLDPGQTRDDVAAPQSQDRRLRDDVPPHHGS